MGETEVGYMCVGLLKRLVACCTYVLALPRLSSDGHGFENS